MQEIQYSKQQLEAIHTLEGPVLVISCAGSGKTSVILERTHQLLEQKARPQEILVVTFSKASATEMSQRFKKQYGNIPVRFSTIHSLCYSILARAYQLTAEQILSEENRKHFFTQAYWEISKKYKEVPKNFDDFYQQMNTVIAKDMSSIRSEQTGNQRNNCSIPNQSKMEDYQRMVYDEYTAYKKHKKCVDFDDMILRTYECLINYPEVLQYWQQIFSYFMIDEFQDTTEIQAEIFYLLAGEKHNICVVGDDDQSIYSFRGAMSHILMDFEKRYPMCKRIILETNYRSLPGIVHCASQVISLNEHRFEKKFMTARTGNADVSINQVNSAASQMSFLINDIRNSVTVGYDFSDMCVLYRTKKEAASLVSQLLLEDIPFYTREIPEDLHNGLVFNDVMAYYRLANGTYGTQDLPRVINRPKRYIKSNFVRGVMVDKKSLYQACCREAMTTREASAMDATFTKLMIDLRNLKELKPTQFMQYLKSQMYYVESLDEYANFVGADGDQFSMEFASLMEESKYFETMEEWMNYSENFKSLTRNHLDQENGITLSTFHGAKGLEWPKVYIISANQGVTPYRYQRKIENPEEERRLFYVAMTRAKNALDIIYLNGNGKIPSEYIKPFLTKNE